MCVLCKEIRRLGDEDVLHLLQEAKSSIDAAMCVQAVDQGAHCRAAHRDGIGSRGLSSGGKPASGFPDDVWTARHAALAPTARGHAIGTLVSSLLNKVIARLYSGHVSFSRNKNFVTYQDPTVKRAARIYRHLKSLENDLLAYGSPDNVQLREPHEGPMDQTRVELTIDALGCTRTAFLSPFELHLLRSNPSLSALLVAAAP